MAWWGFLISYDSAYAGRAPSSSSGLRLVRQRSRSVVGRISRSKCCARLLRRAHYPRQFGGGLCIANEPCAAPPPVWRGGSPSHLAHERIHRMPWRRLRTLHSAVPELQEQLHTGAIDRREFLRTVTLLGIT